MNNLKDNIFAQRLKELRHDRKKITQDMLANDLQVSKTTISNYETGYSMPDIETLIRIATYFNVSTDYLLGRTKSILREENMPYIREDKVDFFKKFTSANPHAEDQIIEGYIARPYFEKDDGEFLFAYELEEDSTCGFLKQDIVYVTCCDHYHKGDKLLVFDHQRTSVIKMESEDSHTHKIIGKVIGVYKTFIA